MPKKTNTMKTPKPDTPLWAVILRNRLNHLNNRKSQYLSSQIDYYKQYENLCLILDEVPPTTDNDGKIQTIKAQIYDVQQNISIIDTCILWCESQIQETLDRADDSKFIAGLVEAPEPPDSLFENYKHLKEKAWKIGGDVHSEKDAPSPKQKRNARGKGS